MKQIIIFAIIIFFNIACTKEDSNKSPIIIEDLDEIYPLGNVDTQKNMKILTNYENPMVILAIGQSNMANSGATVDPFYYVASSDVFYFDGINLSEYRSPIEYNNHIASGNFSVFLPYLGDLLLEHTDYDAIVFINISVSGSSIYDWNNQHYTRISYAKDLMVALNLKATHIIWHQGEADSASNTSFGAYKNGLAALKSKIREYGIYTNMYVARVSYFKGQTNQNIIDAQNSFIYENDDVQEGPNTDILGEAYRTQDKDDKDVHFNKIGLKEHAEQWLQYLM